MINLYGLEFHKLEHLLVDEGQKKFKAVQLYNWIYTKKAETFDEMSDISLAFRRTLNEKYCLSLPKVYTRQESSDGTIKLLLEMDDGMKVETVLMRYDYGNVACVSSQVGCSMGCTFCASGLLGKKRNLETHEMVGEVILLNKELEKENKGQRVTHVVLMGTGEPFDNYDNVMDFIRIINNQRGLSIGARHITVSTCGLPEQIRKYGREGLQTNLAISLHAPNNELRNQIMNINKVHPIEEVMDAVEEYTDYAGRRVTFEYLLLDHLNDTKECCEQLIKLVKPINGYVNLIPYNETNLCHYKRSSNNRVHYFADMLAKNGVNVTIRKEFGSDIDAACGQLRAKVELKDE